MKLTCPACQTRFRVDPASIPEGGVRFRCGQCRKLFRMTLRKRPERAAAPLEAPAAPKPVPIAAAPMPAPVAAARRVAPPAPREEPMLPEDLPAPLPTVVDAPTRIPAPRVAVPPHVVEIQRLARVVISDLELYDARRVESAILDGRFEDAFRSDLEEARRLVRIRHAQIEDAVATFEKAIDALCEQRRLKALAAR